ncbi:MAG: hypothetical protein PVF96_08860, partial [Candidatus Bathyarchaeota archaeon]
IASILLSVVILSVASLTTTVNASITGHNWVGALINGQYDPFYGTTIYAFEAGTTVTLVVNVYSNYWYMGDYRQVNVSAVIVNFDWGINYTFGEASLSDPAEIPYGESRVFSVTFAAPGVSVASNYVPHTYTIFVEHVNASNGVIMDTWTLSGSGFVVFSASQADAFRARREMDSYPTITIPFLTAHARELLTLASIERSLGSSYYGAGDFDNAKTHYETALSYMQQAYANETERWGSFEDTFEGLLKGAEGLLTFQGYSWLIIGIGFLLMGVGVIVYLVRKSGTPKISTE